MTLEDIRNSTDKKIIENENFIKYTFYELRVKEDLSEEEMYSFISLAGTRLKNLGYAIYRTGQKYFYNYKENIVKENELIVAIKQKGGTKNERIK